MTRTTAVLDDQGNLQEVEDYTVLYVIVRNDLPSMNPGKAEAHSGHAASKFVYENLKPSDEDIDPLFEEWAGTRGFGTQINLNGSMEDIISLERLLNNMKEQFGEENLPYFQKGRIIDPSYPFFNTFDEQLELRSACTAFYFFTTKYNRLALDYISKLGLKK